ncbi:phosphotransferase family protein [Streptomyces sp. NPDC002564]|uniref:phosphotransferase family protein n=1 Tax=Streptomyces sp. NPDC002564 TaxID=3364649 RepID=UPI0036BE83B5
MSSPLPRKAPAILARRLRSVLRHGPGGERAAGHHNSNYVVRLGRPLALLLGNPRFGAHAKFRTPLPGAQVCPRAWPRESDILGAVARHLPEVPRCLVDFGTSALHEYRPGRTLAAVAPYGPVGYELLQEFADFFARVAGIPADDLPPLPGGWPASGDSTGFLRRLADWTEHRVRRPHRERFGALLDALGVPEDAMERVKLRHGALVPRPFCLLHTDVHRGNVILGDQDIAVIDWELALYGDPLHDLATHLVRMEYDDADRDQMVKLWAEAMHAAGRGELTEGLVDDLPAYLDLEYAQSVFADVMRAALGLPGTPGDTELSAAAWRVCRAVGLAAGPLGLDAVPDVEQAMDALRDWQASGR